MLSAFHAQPLVDFKQRDKSKIESILAHGIVFLSFFPFLMLYWCIGPHPNYQLTGDRLLVGLNSGSLRIYRINELEPETLLHDKDDDGDGRPASKSGVKAVDLMREHENFSKYKVEQLALVKEASVLLSLSNGAVHVHDLQSYELQETLQKAKGASYLSVTSNIVKDIETGVAQIVSRLAVAVKRRLLIWSWHDGELETDTREVTLVTGIKTLTWATGSRLIAGLNSSYVLVDIETYAITNIVGPGSIGGAPGQDGGRFSGAGVAGMGYLGMTAPTPLATKLREGEMLLAKDINTHFIDTDANPLGRRQIPWAIAPEAVGYSYPYLLALQSAKGTLEIRNPETLTLLQRLSLSSASQLHVPQSNISLAHAGKGFLVASDRAIWRMKALDYDIQIDTLFEHGRLDEAISLLEMLEDALLTDKTAKMKEVKILKAQNLFDQRKFRDAIDLFTEISAPPERVIRLFPPFIAGTASTTHQDSQVESPSSNKSENYGHSQRVSKSEDSNVSKAPSEVGSPGKKDVRAREVNDEKPLEGKDLKLATEELRGFLVSARTKMKKVLSTEDGALKTDGLDAVPSSEIGALLSKSSFDARSDREQLLNTAKLVDTTLFRAYMFVSPSFAGPLFRIDNFCDPAVVNEKLTEAGRYNDLVDFFYGKKMHKQALELLKRFGETNNEGEADPQLAGPRRTVAYLQNLPPEMIYLIIRFSEWPLKKDPGLGMEVFLADTENAETLPRPAVLQFLHGIDKRFAVQYLEHIIHELNDTTPDFHQRLVDIYIQGLKSGNFNNDKERLEWTDKTLDFLRSSKNYQAYKALGQLDKDDPNLYEARAIVLSNMGQHKQALDIYVFKLQDANKAEEYCNQVYMTESSQKAHPTSPGLASTSTMMDPEDNPPSIYHTLLSLYLSPPPPHEPQWGPALSILARHGARVPASSALDLIPESLPVKDLESYFRGRVRAANTIVNEGRVIAGLRSALAFSEEAKLRLGDSLPSSNGGRNRRIVITEDRVCGICHKRFGGSAIKVMPK